MKFISDKLGPIPESWFENEPSDKSEPPKFVPAYTPEKPKPEYDKYKPGEEVGGY